jgi:hypothetical protein
LEIVGRGRLSKSAVFDRFSHISRTLGLQVQSQSARGLEGPISTIIGGAYVRFSMVDLPLFDVRSKIVGHEGRVTLNE